MIQKLSYYHINFIRGGCNCICTYYSNGQSGMFITSLGEIPDTSTCNKLCTLANRGKMEGCFEKTEKIRTYLERNSNTLNPV